MDRLHDDYRVFIQTVVSQQCSGASIYGFGSRMSGNPRPYSDCDVAIDAGGPIPLSQLLKIEEILAESDFPFRVDIVDLHRVSPEFRSIIDQQLKPLA